MKLLTRNSLAEILEEKIQILHFGDFVNVGCGDFFIQSFEGKSAKKDALAFRASLLVELVNVICPDDQPVKPARKRSKA